MQTSHFAHIHNNTYYLRMWRGGLKAVQGHLRTGGYHKCKPTTDFKSMYPPTLFIKKKILIFKWTAWKCSGILHAKYLKESKKLALILPSLFFPQFGGKCQKWSVFYYLVIALIYNFLLLVISYFPSTTNAKSH